jgi:large exoprotein involved in heme utilization and adhesion
VTISGIGPELTDAAYLVSLYNAQMSTAVEGGSQALPPGTITITADTMVMSGRTSIYGFSTSPAPAGNIALNVNTLRSNANPDGTPLNDGQPQSLLASIGFGTESTSGRGGTVTISGIGPGPTDSAKLIALNNTEVSTSVFGGTATTRPASITMTADTINVTNSPKINTDSAGRAPAGQIALTAKTLEIDRGTVSTSSSGAGSGGPIAIRASEGVLFQNGSTITASSSGQGDAGSISINAGAQFLSQNSGVATEAGQASGGNIFIQATESIRLINSQLNTSVRGGPNTSGGNITLDPPVVTLQNSQVRADAVQGNGGNINIIAGTFLTDPTSVVSASSQFGLSGSVNIQSPVSNLSGTLVTLPQRPLQAQQLLQQPCAAQVNGHMSSLVIAGRDALPVEPGDWLMSPLVFSGEVSSTATPPPLPGNLTNLSELSEVWKKKFDQHSSAVRHSPRDSKTGCGS